MESQIKREYNLLQPFKYGCNPNQHAGLYTNSDDEPIFHLLNGTIGYINTLDAINSWKLVNELKESLKLSQLSCAASFKHVSPAGVGTSVVLSDLDRQQFMLPPQLELSDIATAYIRARGSDPMCSFGDFIALSDTCDLITANLIKIEVSDGIIAPDYTPEAFEVLKKKKQGGFVILKGNYIKNTIEIRDFGNMTLIQDTNNVIFRKEEHLKNCVTKTKENIDLNDLVIASITAKYTQSNSVVYAYGGQTIGIGAGQQSRIDCIKLAGHKADKWFYRRDPQVFQLRFKNKIKRQDKINAIVEYVENDFTLFSYQNWLELFELEPKSFVKSKIPNVVSLSSDAFMPNRDNIDHAYRHGVKYIVQPGGSIADKSVIETCNDYGIQMYFSGLRLFHH